MKYYYVYIITNLKNSMKYIGCRTSSILPELDLGHKYFSSSSDAEFIKEQIENPSRFSYEILSIFESRKDALSMEVKLHKEFNVGKNDMFYNKSNQTSNGFDFDITGNKEIAKKISDSMKGKPAHNAGLKQSEETKNKRSESLKGRKSPMTGRTHNDDTKLKMSESRKGKLHNEETKRKISDSHKLILRKPHSEETKRKLSESHKGLPGTMLGKLHKEETKKKMSIAKIGKKWDQRNIECPHCNKIGGASNMKRYHFDNCKHINN